MLVNIFSFCSVFYAYMQSLYAYKYTKSLYTYKIEKDVHIQRRSIQIKKKNKTKLWYLLSEQNYFF